MVNFHVLIDEDAQKFLDDLPSKSNRIVKDKLKLLEEDPFPGKHGDKELLHFSDYDAYRMILYRILSNLQERKNSENPMAWHYRAGA